MACRLTQTTGSRLVFNIDHGQTIILHFFGFTLYAFLLDAEIQGVFRRSELIVSSCPSHLDLQNLELVLFRSSGNDLHIDLPVDVAHIQCLRHPKGLLLLGIADLPQ